jgi:hypothetical protein
MRSICGKFPLNPPGRRPEIRRLGCTVADQKG